MKRPPKAKAAALTIGVVMLIAGSSAATAHPVATYKPYSGPFKPLEVLDPTPAPTEAPSPSEAVPRAIRQLPSRSVIGTASRYAWRIGQAAAGPALREALGRYWRGSKVSVCDASDTCVWVVLTDWCQCYGTRLIDLDNRSFAALADPSMGLLTVTVRW